MKTPAEINAYNQDRNRRDRNAFDKYLKSDETCRRAYEAIKRDQTTKCLGATHEYFRKAYDSLASDKKRFSQRARASNSRQPLFRIGPELPTPCQFPPARAMRTIDGFVRDFLRAHQPLRKKQAWSALKSALVRISDNNVVISVSDRKDPRKDRYEFSIEGKPARIAYGQFEKRFTEARKPLPVLG